VIFLARFVFKRSRQSERVQQRDGAKHTERAVDQSPTNRYLANGSADERQRDHKHTYPLRKMEITAKAPVVVVMPYASPTLSSVSSVPAFYK
jgi:hypothetical protein